MIQSTVKGTYGKKAEFQEIIKREYDDFKFNFKAKTCEVTFTDYAVKQIQQPTYTGSIITNDLLETGTEMVKSLQLITTTKITLQIVEIQQLFEMLQNPITTDKNICNEIERMVTIAGLFKCQSGLNDDGITTDYRILPDQWEIVSINGQKK